MDNVTKVRKYLNRQQWMTIIESCQNSGLSVKQWCLNNNVCEQSYYRNLKKIRESMIPSLPVEMKSSLVKAEPDTTVSFRKLEVQSPVSDMAPAVIIRLPYASLEISNDASQRTIEAVLLALKSTC